ncbi:hypothetical protein HanXRQr2_Chr17g0787821 [Helianthus annuus]|uniref:Uncharacterized protein n=1 Tax=Helianthus annuus TaxID=4232 RepID=A0A9K3GTU0_HELAN|nr:hypothetical protein HanXRQr2_Chr17g0787821 [Helianthus annuus]KAJ0811895.1 hypothetical protein HanPSC8_Chr17g0755851 [Helianthus annuus]
MVFRCYLGIERMQFHHLRIRNQFRITLGPSERVHQGMASK